MDSGRVRPQPTFTETGVGERSLEGSRETSVSSSQKLYLCCNVVFCSTECLGWWETERGGKCCFCFWSSKSNMTPSLRSQVVIKQETCALRIPLIATNPPPSTSIIYACSYNGLSIQIDFFSQALRKCSLLHEGCLRYQVLRNDGCRYNSLEFHVD